MNLRVLQWNVWYKENIENVLAVLREHPADVICLQELTRGYAEQTHADTLEYLAKGLGYEFQVQEMPIEEDGTHWLQANAIFSRYPIVEETTAWINEPLGTNGYDDEYRGYLEVVLDVNSNRAVVATTHMSYTHQFATTPHKAVEIKRLTDLIGVDRQHYIFTGDLNALPDSPTIKALQERLEHAGPDYTQNTWTTKPFRYDGFEASTLDWRLDYVFVSRDVTVHSAEIITTNYSDHLPVLLELEIE